MLLTHPIVKCLQGGRKNSGSCYNRKEMPQCPRPEVRTLAIDSTLFRQGTVDLSKLRLFYDGGIFDTLLRGLKFVGVQIVSSFKTTSIWKAFLKMRTYFRDTVYGPSVVWCVINLALTCDHFVHTSFAVCESPIDTKPFHLKLLPDRCNGHAKKASLPISSTSRPFFPWRKEHPTGGLVDWRARRLYRNSQRV